MARIKLNMSFSDAIIELSEGNPGALTVLMHIMRDGDAIDPDNAFGGFGRPDLYA